MPLGTDPRVIAEAVGASISDEEIVGRVLSGEMAAFEVIMRRYNQRLYRAARGVLRDETEAEDVVQETYLQSLRHLRAFRWQSSLATWLTRIAVNEACARRRKRRRTMPGDGGAGIGESADAPIRRREAGESIREHVDALPSSLRVVLVLRAVEGLSTAETAESLGLTEEAVKVRLHRARAALQRRMASELVDELQSVYSFDGERCDRIVHGVMARSAAALRERS
jgi:RNA polymerase sigma-70 factor, ECF subfamily